MTLDTKGRVVAYIEDHQRRMGFSPTCVGLNCGDYVKVAEDAGMSGWQARCTNVTFSLLGVPIVRLP